MTTGPTGAQPSGDEIQIHHAETSERGAFYVEAGGERLAELTYSRPSERTAVLEHTSVSDRLGGRGVGKRLVLAAVEWARRTGTKLTPVCSYASSVFRKDPSLGDVLERR
jgi:predicted GNAT family acetyltransferase